MQLPEGFLERMRSIPSFDEVAFLKSLDAPRVRAIRMGSLKVDESALAFSPAKEPIPWEEGAYVAGEFSGNDIAHRIGMYYAQEPAAMQPVSALNWQSDWHVLDLCASPGGKTHQLACRLTEGFLVSNEIVPSRARTLLSNAERMGMGRIAVTNASPDVLAKHLAGAFDAILVDAPCSGEGLFRRDPEAMNEWAPERSDGCAQRQMEILTQADKMLKAGGYLVYSTCTFSAQENEYVTAWLVNELGYTLVPAKDPVVQHSAPGMEIDGVSYADSRRYYPYLGCGEGQFLAVLQKGDGEVPRAKGKDAALSRPTKDMQKLCDAFLKETLGKYDGEVLLHKDTLVLVPYDRVELPQSVRPLRIGTAIGTVEKGRMIPHHHFFSAMGKHFLHKLELSMDDPRAAAYLRGEELDAEGMADGHAVVMIAGCAAGGVRIKKGRAKNLYPKGLRG